MENLVDNNAVIDTEIDNDDELNGVKIQFVRDPIKRISKNRLSKLAKSAYKLSDVKSLLRLIDSNCKKGIVVTELTGLDYHVALFYSKQLFDRGLSVQMVFLGDRAAVLVSIM